MSTKVAALPVPATGRRERERARRQSEVLAAARELFARKGYQRSTMVEISAAAELALGTLYQLFPSKEAILCSLLEDYIDVLSARVREAARAPGDARSQLQRIVATQLRFSQENADILRFYLTGWTGYEFAVRQLFGDRIDAKYEQYLDFLAGVFRRGMREGTFVAAPPRRLAIALAGMIHALTRRWLREKRLNLLVEGEALVQMMVYGAARGARNGNGERNGHRNGDRR